MGLGNCNRGTNVESFIEVAAVHIGNQMPEGVNRRDLLGVRPTLVRANVEDWTGQLEVRHVIRVEFARCHSQSSVNAVASRVGSDGVALRGMADCADHRAADEWVRMAPADGDGVDAECFAVGGQIDVVQLGEFGNGDGVVVFGYAGLLGRRGGGWGAHDVLMEVQWVCCLD